MNKKRALSMLMVASVAVICMNTIVLAINQPELVNSMNFTFDVEEDSCELPDVETKYYVEGTFVGDWTVLCSEDWSDYTDTFDGSLDLGNFGVDDEVLVCIASNSSTDDTDIAVSMQFTPEDEGSITISTSPPWIDDGEVAISSALITMPDEEVEDVSVEIGLHYVQDC